MLRGDHDQHTARAGNQAAVPDRRRRARGHPRAPAPRRSAAAACRRTACSTPPTSGCGSRRCVLRIRMEAGRSLLTYKGPVQPSPLEAARGARDDRRATARRCSTSSSSSGSRSGSATRSTARSSARRDAIIALDETPIGTFVEIEGSEAAITELTAALGRSEPTTSSTPTAACTCSTARRNGHRRAGHGVRGIGCEHRALAAARPRPDRRPRHATAAAVRASARSRRCRSPASRSSAASSRWLAAAASPTRC